MDKQFLDSCNERLSEKLRLISLQFDFSQTVLATQNIELLSGLLLSEREAFARAFGVMTLYLGEEVDNVKVSEELSVQAAFPPGFLAEELNVLNVGCGDRVIRSDFLCLDGFRSSSDDQASGRHSSAFTGSMLSSMDSLPFRESTIDVILSLHSLEHLAEPISVLEAWIDLLKPGGGIGLILPDFRYTYSARHDDSAFGHKWDPSPEVFEEWHEKYLKDIVILERLGTIETRLSFDVVLRKPGEFRSFAQIFSEQSLLSGKALDRLGYFPNDVY